MKKIIKRASILASLALLAACGSGINGTYADSTGIMELKFEGDKVTQSTMGIQLEMKYEVDGDKIKVINPQGTLVMTRQSDGSILGPLGIVLTKKK